MTARLFALLALWAFVGYSQSAPYPITSKSQWQSGVSTGVSGLTYVPGSLTDVTTQDSYVGFVMFSNDDASNTATIRVTDKTTNCGGAACPLWSDITLAPKTRYIADEHGVLAKAGIQWRATGSAVVVGWMRGTY